MFFSLRRNDKVKKAVLIYKRRATLESKASLTKKKMKSVLTSIAAVLASILIPLLGIQYTDMQKTKELNKGFVELGIKILSDKPTKESEPIRQWALDIVNKYAEVKMNQDVVSLLRDNLAIVNPIPGGISKKEFDGLWSEGFVMGSMISKFDDVAIKNLNEKGLKFVYIKASQGIDRKDSKFQRFVNDARKEKMYYGIFHVYSVGLDPKAQGENFIFQLKQVQCSLPPMVDCEEFNNSPSSKYADDLFSFLEFIMQQTRVKPVLYLTKEFAEKYLDERFSGFPICLSNLRQKRGLSKPVLPRFWTKVLFLHFATGINDNDGLGSIEVNLLGFPGNVSELGRLSDELRTDK